MFTLGFILVSIPLNVRSLAKIGTRSLFSAELLYRRCGIHLIHDIEMLAVVHVNYYLSSTVLFMPLSTFLYWLFLSLSFGV